ncbi:hypothetical protein [Candidatus Pelagibacter communis]|uniref:hypothetical protein n=1 Tax=Pelagibacter ubique TaxID=198252 RepID=UPI00094C09AE|nr:hypothetical protein [Candidatus Pelagibacter ubique]
MTKTIIDLKTGITSVEEYTAEELAQKETDKVNGEAFDTEQANAKQAQEDLKASAKAKLIAGEALTEEEANTIVL